MLFKIYNSEIFIPDKYANEKNSELKKRLKNQTYERQEISLIKKYISPYDSILELGACIGVVGVICNKILKYKHRHTIIEANPNLIPVIEKNKAMNACCFELLHGLIKCSNDTGPYESFFVSDFIISSSKQLKENKKETQVPTIDLHLIFKKKNPNFLIIDIEGGEYEFINFYINKIKSVNKMLIEFHFMKGKNISNEIKRLKKYGFNLIERKGMVCYFGRHPNYL